MTEFASLLTELKGRTERSYGSLARHLGMNTSTLHRYCAGEALPQDFAPVERLAEFCGATPEERLELHRRWLRAAAARQRPRDTAAETPEQAETAAITETTERSGAPAPAPAADSCGSSADAEIGTSAVTATQKPASTQVPPDRWYRRRTPVLVGAACALLATLGTLSALPGGNHPSKPDDAARSAASPAVSFPAAVPGRSSAPTPNPTPASAAPAIPSPSSSRLPHPDRTSPVAEAAPADVGAPTAPATGEPLTLTVDSQVWAQGCGHDYVIDKAPAQVPPPPVAQDAGPWASAQGAVHGRETNVEITVQGRRSSAVTLTALRVQVVGRATPAPGTVYAMELGCGGSLSKRYFAVDLDQDHPRARSVAGADVDTPIPAVRLPYRVSSKHPEVLLVTARTEGCDCSWYLELDWSSEGRSGTVRIDDHGRPFRTTSIKGLPRYWYGSDDGDRHWLPVTD